MIEIEHYRRYIDLLIVWLPYFRLYHVLLNLWSPYYSINSIFFTWRLLFWSIHGIWILQHQNFLYFLDSHCDATSSSAVEGESITLNCFTPITNSDYFVEVHFARSNSSEVLLCKYKVSWYKSCLARYCSIYLNVC